MSTTQVRSSSPAPPRQEQEIRLPWWKRLLFTGIILVLCAGMLELAGRWYLSTFHGFDGRHLLQYEFDPYKNILPTRNYVDTRGVEHNAVGFRRTGEVQRIKPGGTYRVFLMGASAAYGTGGLWPHIQRDYAVLRNDQTIDSYLEAWLTERFPGTRFEVINAAVPSTWTHHDLIYLNQTVLRYQPDMVVFFDGFNDFFHTDPEHDQFAEYAYGEHATRIMGPPTLGALAAANGWWLSRKSAFAYVAVRQFRTARLVVASLFGDEEPRPMDVERSTVRLQQVFAANALAMVRRSTVLLQAEGVASAFVLQPMLILERERSGMPAIERELFDFNVSSYRPNYEAFIQRAIPLLRDMTSGAVETAGGQFIDGTVMFDRADTAQIFTDYVHLTPYGNRLAASFIGERISPRIRRDLDDAPADDVVAVHQDR